MKLFIELIKFLQHPKDEQYEISFRQKLRIFGILLLFEIAILCFIVYPIYEFVNYITPLREATVLEDYTLITSILMLVLLVPLIEEFFFRCILRYSGLVAIIVSRESWDKIFPYLVYILSLSFGIVHASNYDNNDTIYYIFIPFLFLSQITGGLIISFIRVKLNFWWGVLFHSSWNLLFVILFPLIFSLFDKPFIQEDNRYSLVIEEVPFFKSNNPKILQIKNQNDTIYLISVKQQSFQSVLDTLYGKGSYYTDPILINLSLESEKGILKNELLNVIKDEYDIISLETLKKIK
jgi:membrane protease YdiL (CAAX protease family)